MNNYLKWLNENWPVIAFIGSTVWFASSINSKVDTLTSSVNTLTTIVQNQGKQNTEILLSIQKLQLTKQDKED